MENILRWFAGIGGTFKTLTGYFSRSPRAVPDDAAQTPAKSAAAEAGAVAAATENVVAPPLPPPASVTAIVAEATAVAADTVAVAAAGATADAKIGEDAQVGGTVAAATPEPQEIQRRRELVRKLFNDFWSGCDDKPATFVDRLDQAESYLNERLTACGEVWQLDARTRKMLSLPPRSASPNKGGGAVHH